MEQGPGQDSPRGLTSDPVVNNLLTESLPQLHPTQASDTLPQEPFKIDFAGFESEATLSRPNCPI